MRIVPLKVMNSIRYILILIRQYEECRKLIVESLKTNDFNVICKTFAEIDLDSIPMETDHKKIVAFQLCQTLSLIHGQQLFTKSDLASKYPQVSHFLYRLQQNDQQRNALNQLKLNLMQSIANVGFRKKEDLHCLFVKPNISQISNFFEFQSFGTVIDFNREVTRLHYYCIDFPTPKLTFSCDWPTPCMCDLPKNLEFSNFIFVYRLKKNNEIAFGHNGSFELHPSIQKQAASELKKVRISLSNPDPARCCWLFLWNAQQCDLTLIAKRDLNTMTLHHELFILNN